MLGALFALFNLFGGFVRVLKYLPLAKKFSLQILNAFRVRGHYCTLIWNLVVHGLSMSESCPADHLRRSTYS